MKTLLAILALFCCSGVLSFSYAQDKMADGLEQNVGLSDSELQQIRERLPCLQPGMTRKEVYDLLGVDLSERAYAIWGSGPSNDYSVVYQLAPASSEHGYNLILVYNGEREFKRAEIACWTQPNKCAEDNEKAESNPKECPDESKQ